MQSTPDYTEAFELLRTVRDVLRFAVSRFRANHLVFGHGSTNAWDEAVYLILHTLNLPIDQLDPYLDARLTTSELRTVLNVLERRIEGRIPAAYLTREAWLGHYQFYVDERVIVPRSYVAELLFEGLAPWVTQPEQVTRVLDLCTGSGCLAIIAADVFPDAIVDAVDISAAALQVAKLNVERYGLSGRVNLIESDLYRGLAGQKYDIILSNPPYVREASVVDLPEEYKKEPLLALAGGADGMDLVRTIVGEAARHLRPAPGHAGFIVLEIGHERNHFELSFPDLQYTWVATSGGDEMVLLVDMDDLPTPIQHDPD